jgi:cytochrome c peroxidase
MKIKTIAIAIIGILALAAAALAIRSASGPQRTNEERSVLRSLWIGSLPDLPPDPTNAYADDLAAARLGQALFFDPRLSANGAVSCATCHRPDNLFQDGVPLAQGIGGTNRRTMTVIGAAYSPWLFWDGRKDSLWSQALGPLENPVEHGGNRTLYAHLIGREYRDEYEALFGPLPDLLRLPSQAGPVVDTAARAAWEAMPAGDREAVNRIYANIGKAIAAYERLLFPGPSRFDAYVEALLADGERPAAGLMNEDEIAGLRLFIGPAKCIRCHNGPLFTNNDFHNTGVPAAAGLPADRGRAAGAPQVVTDEFNCLSVYSDSAAEACDELRFMVLDPFRQERQFKPPSLRNVAERGPYMHAGQFATLEAVLAHYNRAPAAPSGHSEMEPLHLSDREIAQIITFLETLSAPVNADPAWLWAPVTTPGS